MSPRRRHSGGLLPLAATALAVIAVAPAIAQQIVASGRALDSNLRLGSGGYNSPGMGGRVYGGGRRWGGTDDAIAFERGRYRAGPQRDYYNAFLDEKRYRGTEYGLDTTGGYGWWGASGGRGGGGGGGGRRGGGATALPTYETAPPVEVTAGPEIEVPAPAPAPDQDAAFTERAAKQMGLISYALGYFVGEEVRTDLDRDKIDADLDTLVEGFADGLGLLPPQVPREELEEILAALHRRVTNRMLDEALEANPEFRDRLEDNLARSRAFHEAYGKRDGVVTRPDGIQYRVLEPGNGPSPGPDDAVVVTYRVVGIDGALISEGKAVTVEVNDTIEGAARVLTMMPLGARWEVAIPPDLAFGRGGGDGVDPNESLLCVVELVEIKKK